MKIGEKGKTFGCVLEYVNFFKEKEQNRKIFLTVIGWEMSVLDQRV